MMLAAQGSTVTFEEFYRTEYPRLVPMLRALTGDRQRAEDLAQDALWKAQREWTKISAYDRPGAWVRRVALNASANVRRRERREVAALTRIGAGAQITDDPMAGEAHLWRFVRDLPDQQRWAVALHYVEDRSLADIAAVLGCSEGSVKTHLSRARATLARRLNDLETEQT